MTTSSAQIPTLYQPIYIQPEPKKDKSPPPGANLYNDPFTIYRGFENVSLLLCDPLPYLAGFTLGLFKSGVSYYQNGAPKKIAADGEYIDFGTKVHTEGIGAMFKVFTKRYCFGIIPGANLGKLVELCMDSENTEEAKNSLAFAYGLQHTFVAFKAAMVSDEIIQRIANWIDVPAK